MEIIINLTKRTTGGIETNNTLTTKINTYYGCSLSEKVLLLTVMLISIVTGKVRRADVAHA